jgi:hypothetical protein
LCIEARDSGTVGSLEACIFEIIALNQKKLLNLLTNFLRSLQIHKGPTSDIGTLIKGKATCRKVQGPFMSAAALSFSDICWASQRIDTVQTREASTEDLERERARAPSDG